MIAAAARTSGTSSPSASVLYRGVMATCRACSALTLVCSRCRAAVRARSSRAFRAFEAVAEYVGFLAAARRVAVFDVDVVAAVVARWAVCGAAAAGAAATPTPMARTRAETLTRFAVRIRRTNPPGRQG